MPPKKAAIAKAAAKPAAAAATRKSSRTVAPKKATPVPEEVAPKKPAASKKKGPKPLPEVSFPNLAPNKSKVKAAEPAQAEPITKSAPKRTAATKTKKEGDEAPKTTKKPAATKTKATPAKKAVGRPRKGSTIEPEAAPKVNGKRKASETEEEDEESDEPKAKKAKTGPAVKKPAKPAKELKVINEIPTQRLNVFVCGENSAGELGLGHMRLDGKLVTDVKRPRLNPFLSAKKVGVVTIATGGMHCIAITHDNKILTWGVNDQGALGRDTPKRVRAEGDDESDDDDDDDSGLNPAESTPGAVDNKHFPEGTKFVQAAACDSASFVLTADGYVYGWGTFRGNEGIIGFTPEIKQANYPIKIDKLSKIKHIAAGANHVMAVTHNGATYGWGASEQSQLGRRTVERTKTGALVPREFGLPNKKDNNITYVTCGSYHTFAIDSHKKIWSWGLNNFAETGIAEGAGEDEAFVNKPAIVQSLSGYEIKEIKGGVHHSLACTTDGKLLVWGRMDGHQVGIELDDIPEESVIKDARNEPRILKIPTIIPDINAVHVTAASDTSIAIDNEGKAYSWGFSTNFQTGQGTIEDIKVATHIDNTAVRDIKLNWAGLGGQFAVLTSVADDVPEVNGVKGK